MIELTIVIIVVCLLVFYSLDKAKLLFYFIVAFVHDLTQINNIIIDYNNNYIVMNYYIIGKLIFIFVRSWQQ